MSNSDKRWIGFLHSFGYGGVLRYHKTRVNDIGRNFVFLEIIGPQQHCFDDAKGKAVIAMSIVCPSAIKNIHHQSYILSSGETDKRWGEIPMEERAMWAHEYGAKAKVELGMLKRVSDQRTLKERYNLEWLEDHTNEFWGAASIVAGGALSMLGMFLDCAQNRYGDTGWQLIAGRL